MRDVRLVEMETKAQGVVFPAFAEDLHCAGGGTRTHTRLPSPDFESGLSTILDGAQRQRATAKSLNYAEYSHPLNPSMFAE